MRPAITILTILCLALGVGLLIRHNRAESQAQNDGRQISSLSNDLAKASTERDELRKISLLLETNLTLTAQELSGISNNLIKTTADLEKAKAEAKAAAEAFQAEMKKRDAKIAELEQENSTLEKQSDDLKGAIGGLEKAIVETEKKLAASEGDREFLLKELKRLQAEKAELERQFNDLAVLRQQVSRLKEELSIARRIDWIKRGIFGFSETKGGQLLLQNNKPSPKESTPASSSNFTLQAELRSDGSATVTTPKAPAPGQPVVVPAPKPPTPAQPAPPQPAPGNSPLPKPAPAATPNPK
jgi:septal ring factor EnvC (AmiA/AmiB activator)